MIKLYSILVFLYLSQSALGQCIDEKWHNTSNNSVWLSCQPSANPLTFFGETHWILYEFEEVNSIESINIWNINNPQLLSSGAKRLRIDASSDGASWENMGEIELALGSSAKTYTGEEFSDLGIFNAQYVLLTIIENYGGLCSGLAEVQFNLGEGTVPTQDEYLSSLVTISPNPSDNRFNVSLKDIETDEIVYQVVDMTGRIILQDTRNTFGTRNEVDIDGSSLPDGQYSLRIATDQGSITKKIIVVHPR